MTTAAPAHSDNRRLALWALLLFAPLPSLGVWFGAFADAGALGAALWGAAKVALLLGPLIWWRFVQQRRFTLNLQLQTGWQAGLLSGVLLCSVIMAAVWFIALPNLDAAPLRAMLTESGLTTPKQYFMLVAYLTLVNALIEEVIYRWFFFQQLRALLSVKWAVLGAAIIFTAHHTLVLSAYVPWYFNALASLGVFTGGLVWSALYARYQSLWPAYLSHLLADIGVFVAGYWVLFGGAV